MRMRILPILFAFIIISNTHNTYAKPHIDTLEQISNFCKPGYQDKNFCKGYWMGVLEIRSLNCQILNHAFRVGDLTKIKAQKLADIIANDFVGVSNNTLIEIFNAYYKQNKNKGSDRLIVHLKPMFMEKHRCVIK